MPVGMLLAGRGAMRKTETPIGNLPTNGALDLAEVEQNEAYLERFEERLPPVLWDEHHALRESISRASSPSQ
jgi:hypothetical protein